VLHTTYSRLEKPLLILALWLHPAYAEVGRAVVNSGVVNVMTLTEWVDGYGERWGFKDGAVSASLAVHDWHARFEQWSKHSNSFGVEAAKYWSFVEASSRASSASCAVRSRRLLAKVAGKLLSVLPNATDPERVFSEIGRMITPSRTSLADAQSARMLFIAADCRAQERDGVSGGSVTRRTLKKFTKRAAVVLRLHSIGRQSVSVVSNVPQGGMVEVIASTSVGQSSAGDSEVQVAAGEEPAVSIEERGTEGVDADVSKEHTEDEEVTALAMGDPLEFATKFAEAVAASGLDTDESTAPGPGDAMDTGLEKWPMGELPEDNDQDVPQDTMIGFRSMGGTLAELF
jgi:fructose-specific phosphotransferase system component IIB